MVAGLGVLLHFAGLDRADKIASVAAATIALIALPFTLGAGRGSVGPSPVVTPAQILPPSIPYPPGPDPRAWHHPGPAMMPQPQRSGAGMVLVLVAVNVAVCVLGAALTLPNSGFRSGDGRSPSGGLTSTTPPAALVRWKGEVRLDENGIDYDEAPPLRYTESWSTGDGALDSRIFQAAAGNVVVAWAGKDAPRYDECLSRLSTHGVTAAEAGVGARFCLRTDQRRIVLVEVRKKSGSGFLAEATVWHAL